MALCIGSYRARSGYFRTGVTDVLAMFHARCSLSDTQGEIKTSGAKEVTLLEVKEEELEALAFGEKDDRRGEGVEMFGGGPPFVCVRPVGCPPAPPPPLWPFSCPENPADGLISFSPPARGRAKLEWH